PPATYALSLHDALPISGEYRVDVPVPRRQVGLIEPACPVPGCCEQIRRRCGLSVVRPLGRVRWSTHDVPPLGRTCSVYGALSMVDRKSTRLNSSHVKIS